MTNSIQNGRTYGIEIECKQPRARGETGRNEIAALIQSKGVDSNSEGYNHRTSSNWKVITDASVGSYADGIEIVSPILTGEEGLRQLALVLEALNEYGCKVDRQCGIHVHWGIADLTLNSVKNVCAMYSKYEAQIDRLMPRSRRANNNQYCRSMNNNGVTSTMAAIKASDSMEALKSAVNQGTRYRKLNLESFWRYSTMEFRQHAGSLDFAKIRAWVFLTGGLVEEGVKAKRVNSIGGDNSEALLAHVKDRKAKKFLRNRIIELGA